MQTIRTMAPGLAGIAVLAAALSIPSAWADDYLSGRATIVDGERLTIGGKMVSLYGIEAPALDAKCYEWRGTSQITYDCGKHAKAFLASLANARDFVCVTAAGGNGSQVTCYSDGADVAQAMVRAGWAVACGYASRYVPDATAARTARAGLWAGNFNDIGRCPAGK